MKKLITISLFIFWAIVVAILTAGLIFYQNSKNIISNNSKNIFTMNSSNNSLATGSTNDQNATSATNQSSQSLSLSLSEIAKHSTPSDCWLLISNKVYNVSSFIAAHPGGSGTIIPNCGKDSTQAYSTKGGDGSHSANANTMLRDYYIGDLNQAVSVPGIKPGPAKATPGINGTQINPTSAPSPNPVINTNSGVALNMVEIAKHSTPSDCWLLISNKVYNVSSFIAAHPGGSGTIIPNCGKDSTQAYNTKGGNSSHSANATAMLRDYYIGDLNQQTSQQQIQQNVQNTNMVPPPAGGEEEEEEDD